MITVTLILLIIAALCAVLALIGVPSRIDLTAIGLLFVVMATFTSGPD
jgi:hypothetical protein